MSRRAPGSNADASVGGVLARRAPQTDSLGLVGAFWFLLVGVLLIAVALLGRLLDRLPVSPAMIYLLVGFALGPAGSQRARAAPDARARAAGGLTEIALLIALFTVGIKMRVPVGDWRWSLPLKLATLSHGADHRGIAPPRTGGSECRSGLAVVLGAALAPTDPVLASDVQLRSPQDRDTCASR